MSTENIYRATISEVKRKLPNIDSLAHLDIGAGSGELIRKLKSQESRITSFACDYTDTLIELEGQKVDIVDLNKDSLPYGKDTFDIVTATEIIEHLENPRSFLRDISRVLKPGGVCVLSTPNVVNLNSRLRYFWFGFPELFGPLSIGSRKIESCSGHISLIPYFYFYHAMRESGFDNISLGVDKFQRSGMLKLFFLYLPIKIKDFLIKRKERRKYNAIDSTNVDVVNKINSKELLLGRTIILSGIKI